MSEARGATLKKVEAIIYEAIEENSSDWGDGVQIDKSPDSVLFGKKGSLDSLGLVNLMITIEQLIEDEYEVSITIANERAVSQTKSPFRTIAVLTKYVTELIQEAESV